MRPLTTHELLDVWEAAAALPPPERALALLAAACPGQPADSLARLSIGQRDARLMTLREWAFGPQMVSVAACPRCGDQLELTFQVADIRVPPAEPPELLSLTMDGHEVRFRPLDSQDLVALGRAGARADGARFLLGRCLLSAHREGKQRAPDDLPDEIVQAVARRMAEADPQADVELALACAACGHQWLAPFDIVSWFWSEIDAWACRLLRDVHCLARAYGWREADILALSPWRRQFYLKMVGA
jgi:hypothetical protein